MSFYLKTEVAPSALPQEFISNSRAFLESSEKLNTAMSIGEWQGSYNRGEVVIWLAFHATELFLKGCILKLNPSARPNGHTLTELLDKLLHLKSSISFEIPFSAEAIPPSPEGMEWVEKQNKIAHESLRYPCDRSGNPWSGVNGFSPESFSETLSTLREQMDFIYNDLFK